MTLFQSMTLPFWRLACVVFLVAAVIAGGLAAWQGKRVARLQEALSVAHAGVDRWQAVAAEASTQAATARAGASRALTECAAQTKAAVDRARSSCRVIQQVKPGQPVSADDLRGVVGQ